MTKRTALIGLGGNLGDRRANLRKALALLNRAPGVRVLSVSRFIETAPVGWMRSRPCAPAHRSTLT